MERIASDGRREFHLHVVSPGGGPGPPFGEEPFAALVWAAERTSAAHKERTCAALIASGCRYLVCGGLEAAAWEEAADITFAAQDLAGSEFEERMVMTTSHEREPVDEAVWFFIRNTGFGDHDFTRCLVLLIGDDPGIRDELIAAMRIEAAR